MFLCIVWEFCICMQFTLIIEKKMLKDKQMSLRAKRSSEVLLE